MEPKQIIENEKDDINEILRISTMAWIASDAQSSVDNILPVETEIPRENFSIYKRLHVYLCRCLYFTVKNV